MRLHIFTVLATAVASQNAGMISNEETSLLQAKIRAAKDSDDCTSGDCNPTTPEPFIITTTTTTLGARRPCKIWGDPHIAPFDMPRKGEAGYVRVDKWIQDNIQFGNMMYENGQFWLVQADDVSIQGQFWSADFFQSSMRSLAVSGKMFGESGKTLIIEPLTLWGHTGKVSYNNGPPLPVEAGMTSFSDDYVEITESWTTILPPSQKIHIKFKQGHYASSLELYVVRHGGAHAGHVDVEIFMQARNDVKGFCGDIDGDFEDESENLALESNRVEDIDLLFPYVSFDVRGCGTVSDIPASFEKYTKMRTRKEGHTAQLCGNVCEGKGFKAFILAGSSTGVEEDCYCGDKTDSSVQSMEVDSTCSRIDCFEGEIQTGATCVYTTKCIEKKPHECAADLKAEGERLCEEHGLTGAAQKSCVFDYCFADGQTLVANDAAFWKVVGETDPGEVGFECKDRKAGNCKAKFCKNEEGVNEYNTFLCPVTCGTC